MKRTVILLLTVILLMPVTACSENQSGGNESISEETQTHEEGPVGALQSSTVIFDFSNGSPEDEFRKETYYSYSEVISDEELIDALSSMSGLDFYVTLSMADGRFVADWAADSTLIAGLDDREQKEDFFFYDAESLRWFMMDSLWRTLGSHEIYYTMDGGKELKFDELYPVNDFPADVPYMGSAFYFSHADVAAVDNSETVISVMTQEYINNDIAEILMISYNGQQPALEEYNWKNPEIDMLNNTIKNGIQQIYNEFLDNRSNGDWLDEREWIEIRSYPFTSDEWLQIVTHYNIYPTYGISGYVQSYNFNKKENRFVTIYDAIEEAGLTEESLIAEAKELFILQSPGMTVDEVKAAGFRINQGLDGPVTQFWFEITAKNSDGNLHQKIFSCIRGYEFMEIIGDCLYEPHDMDVMNPPLSYQQYLSASLNEESAMDLLREELSDKIEEWSANVFEGNSIAIVGYGDEVINGNECWSFALGTNSPETFTAEEYYAVSKDDGIIYYMNIFNEGKYEEYRSH